MMHFVMLYKPYNDVFMTFRSREVMICMERERVWCLSHGFTELAKEVL